MHEEKEKEEIFDGHKSKEAESHVKTMHRERKYIPPHLKDEIKEKQTKFLWSTLEN